MTFLSPFLEGASSSTDLNRKLLTASVSDKLARLLLNILGCAGRLVHRPALLLALSVAHLLCGSVALPHSLIEGLLLESDLTGLLKVLFANLLLTRGKLSDISVVTLFSVLVCTFKDGFLLQGCYLILLFDTTEASVLICLTTREVYTSLDSANFLPPSPSQLVEVCCSKAADEKN